MGSTQTEDPNIRKIGDGSADLALEFDSGATLRVYGLDRKDKLVIREATETKREKAIYGKDLVSVYVHQSGRREIVDWPLNDDNAQSEGFWAWMERIITQPDVDPSPIDDE